MQEKLTKVTPNSKAEGQPCIRCDNDLKNDDAMIECPRCHALHHVNCWKEKGGCSRTGCPQIAQAVVGEKPVGDGPPPPVDRRYVFGGIGIAILLLVAAVVWPKPPDPAGDRHRVVYMTEASIMEQDQLEALTNEFNESHDDVYLDLQMLPYGNMDMKLVVQIGAGAAPDIFTLPAERFAYFSQQEALTNLGTEADPLWGVRHPNQARYLVIFGQTEDPEAARVVFDFLLTHLPEAEDPDALWESEPGANPMMPISPFGL